MMSRSLQSKPEQPQKTHSVALAEMSDRLTEDLRAAGFMVTKTAPSDTTTFQASFRPRQRQAEQTNPAPSSTDGSSEKP